MDPETGKVIWKQQVGAGSALGGIEWGIGADTRYLFAPNTDIVNLFDEYRRARGRATMAEAQPPGRPGLTAVDPKTGKVIWHVPTPKDECTYRPAAYPDVCFATNSGAPAAMPGVVFAGSTDGWFRAHDARTGKVVWKFNSTAQAYDTANGVKGQLGGGMDGNGPTIAAGTVFATSGFDGASNYGSTGFGSNVLLAFTVDGK
jgi:polyvinyl alcohol dehydrogenase (cytochrome)